MTLTADIIRSATALARTLYPAQPEPEPAGDYSERAVKLAALIDGGDFGCRTSAVRELVVLLTGETLPPRDESSDDSTDIRLVPGAMYVPTANPNSHDYEIGRPVVVQATGYGRFACRLDGKTGNHLPTESNAIRPATEAEVDEHADAFVAAISTQAGDDGMPF